MLAVHSGALGQLDELNAAVEVRMDLRDPESRGLRAGHTCDDKQHPNHSTCQESRSHVLLFCRRVHDCRERQIGYAGGMHANTLVCASPSIVQPLAIISSSTAGSIV